ncbi:MAG: hypothetical protein K2N25_02035, partial [Muribaculaceae bacterium]|nr:hypothetical protein [Muribaculaceae bacterium]
QYTNGLFELEAAWKRYNEDLEKNFNQDPVNEGKSFKPEKFPEAIICSGERDSMCAKALGYWPLWFNSETYRVSDREYSQITRMVETVYNIPDIDSTGLLKGRELAMRFIDIHTIWLPASLSELRDHRGRPRKDLRDWCELYPGKEEFKKLVASATPAKFWSAEFRKKEEENVRYKLDPECLMGFLQLNGFYRLNDEHSSESVFVYIDGNRVRQVKTADMRAFVHRWAVANGHPRALRNVILTSPYFSGFNMEMLENVNLDFSKCTARSQIFHFRNTSMEVTRENIRKVDAKKEQVSTYVWEDSVVDKSVSILPDMFRITHPEGCLKSEDFDIEITDLRSNFFKYLINSSRIYWRKEMEQRFEDGQQEARMNYCAAHKFDIAGDGLTPEEIREQKRNLINKIFTVGYLLHRYKDDARSWAPFLMDNVIGQNDQCNGGAGKSFLFAALRNLSKGEKISGRQRDPLGNRFLFERVSRFTDFVYFDDCADNFPFKELYDTISSDIVIDAKNVKSYSLPFKDSPKFAFNSNYVPQEFDPSTVRRMIFVTFSDYYHQSTDDNDYIETRTIADDFGKTLFRENYTDAEWDADFNFMMQCTRFYLSLADKPVKIEPDITNIKYRKYRHDMSENFLNWAEFYFSEDGDNLDRLLVKEDAFNAYKAFSGVSKITMQRFKKSLIGFCYTCEWVAEFNPEPLRNSSGRILKRVKGANGALEQKEMIYLRSRKAAENHWDYNDSTDKPGTVSNGSLASVFAPAPPSSPGQGDYNEVLSHLLDDERDAYGR